MKYIKTYEIFKSPSNWEIGDIVVSIKTKFAGDTLYLHKNYKYEIVDIKHDNTTLKVKEIGYPYSTVYDGTGPILNSCFFKNNFITLEEWELTQSANKFNL